MSESGRPNVARGWLALSQGDALVKCRADALDAAAADLAFGDHRVDHRAAILYDREVEELNERDPRWPNGGAPE